MINVFLVIWVAAMMSIGVTPLFALRGSRQERRIKLLRLQIEEEELKQRLLRLQGRHAELV